MKSSRLEKDKKIEDKIIKDVDELDELDETTVKDTRNLFRLKKENKATKNRNLLSMKKKNIINQ